MKESREIFKVAGSWFLATGAMTVALGYDLSVAYQVGLVAVVAVLVWIAVFILPFERGRQIFFYFDEQPAEVEQFMHIGCLHNIPLIVVVWIPVVLVVRWLTSR